LKAARKQLSDSQPQYDQLALLLSQLQPSDFRVLETEENPATCVEAIVARRQHYSLELEQLVKKLELSVKLLEEAGLEIDDLVAAQVVVKQSVLRELPVRQEDLAKELAELKVILMNECNVQFYCCCHCIIQYCSVMLYPVL